MNDFDDTFGGPPEPGFQEPYGLADTDGYIFAALLILALVVLAVSLSGYFWGRYITKRRMKAEREASRGFIFRHIRYTLDKALLTSGAVILERGREVSDILEARLGLLLALDSKLAKHVATLRKALDPQPAKPEKPGETKAARDTYNHAYTVRAALESLSDFWREDKVLPLIAAAQDELITPPPPEPKPEQTAVWTRRKTPVAQTVKGALDDANKAGTKPVDPLPVKTEEVAPDTEPTPPPPTPPAPPPAPRRRGKLPAHKRNMLA